MERFNFYVSGILYGKLKFDSDQTFLRKLDVFTGELGEWEILTEQDNRFYQSFLKMPIFLYSGITKIGDIRLVIPYSCLSTTLIAPASMLSAMIK